MKGYEGAELAYKMVNDGAYLLVLIIFGLDNLSFLNIYKATFFILAGASNYLFFLAYLYFFKNNRISFFLSSLCLSCMLYWAIVYLPFEGVGFNIWLLSCIGLIVLNSKYLIKNNNETIKSLLLSKGSLASYFVVLYLLSSIILDEMGYL